MNDDALRSPLNWPAGKPRTLGLHRKRAAFGSRAVGGDPALWDELQHAKADALKAFER